MSGQIDFNISFPASASEIDVTQHAPHHPIMMKVPRVCGKRVRTQEVTATPHPKRPRRRRVASSKARGTRETAASPNVFGNRRPAHKFPRSSRDKEWEIEDLDDVDMAEGNKHVIQGLIKPCSKEMV